MQRSFLAVAALAALAGFGIGDARAAPQALALVTTNGPVGLTCSSTECAAELSTYCLQPDRFAPRRGNAYAPANVDQIRLVGTTADGRRVALDAGALLSFESARNHLAVRISLPWAQMTEHDLARVEVEVGERVALLPVAEPDDPSPHTQSEIAVLTGSLRSLGDQVVDQDKGRMQAARITNRMINLLPPDRKAGLAGSRTLWRQAMRDAGGEGLSPEARDKARGAYSFCRFALETGVASDLRSCLQGQHDGFIQFLNSDYWDAIKIGS